MKTKSILKSVIILIFLMSGLLSCKAESEFAAKPIVKSVGKIDVMVDPNVEMMMILGRIAGAGPYAGDRKINEAYVDDVDEYFKDFMYSPAAIRLMRYQLSYQAFPEFGMYLNEDDSDFKLKLNNKNFLVQNRLAPGYIQAKEVSYYIDKAFREAVRTFRKDSDFDRFFLAHQKVYEGMIDQTCDYLNKSDFASWYEDFYGIKLKEHVCLYMTYMSGGGNFGISVRNKKGRDVPHMVVCGGQSVENFLFLISHEFSHPRTNPVLYELAKNEKLINKFTEIYKKYSDTYFRDGYGNGYSIMGEMLNQACANKYLETIFDEEGMEQVNRESLVGSRKYVYTPQIADFLDNYLNNRKRYKTLMDFEPELEKFLETLELE